MVKSTLAAGFVAVIAIASSADSAQARGLGFRGGVHGGVRPFGHIGFPLPPVVPNPVNRWRAWRLRRDVGYGYGLPVVYGPYYDTPVQYINANPLPSDWGSLRPAQRVCRSEVYRVPSESGGRRDVTVWRCYLE